MEKKMSTRSLWREYYIKRDELYDYIKENTICLRSDEENREETDFGRTRRVNKVRGIYYTKDQEMLSSISKKSKELENFFNEITMGKRKSMDIPMIFNDVENINITINEAYESIKIDKNNAEKYFDIVKDSVLRLDWGENYSENMKKYKLENFLQFAAIKNKDLLKLANAKVLQVRKKSGNKYMVKIRKKCEHQSIRERYGFIVVDTIPSIYDSPKQAKRSHSLELIGEEFECPIPSSYTFYIKK
nr:hypothetical protein [uncultured Fusobacterium sp.]